MEIKITKNLQPKTKPSQQSLGFGQYFSDHMFTLEYSPELGWHNAEVKPYQNLALDPAASVLHYGQALFEGMKAFKQKPSSQTEKERIVLFRPEYNCQRLQQGAERLCMIAPPTDMMIEGIKKLVAIDHDWVPEQRGCSLYIRPTLIGTEGFLGVRPSQNYLFYVILSPVGAYYKEGLSPIPIWVEEKDLRAAPGGLGATKAGANYAASLRAALEAKKKGYSQVLWLDVNRQYIEEVGTMNVFFVIDGQVITPSLDGTILSGGVRNSVLELLKSWNIPVQERKISILEILKALQEGKLSEGFGTGTAAVISPIGELAFKTQTFQLNANKIGPLSQRLYDAITAIQYGESTDNFQWLQSID